MFRVLLATAVVTFTSLPWAHLTSGTLKLSRSGPYHPGDTLTISFGVDIPHSGCNIDLTLDGKKWTTLKANMPAPSRQTYSYKWTVGPDTTSKGKIRICQMNGTTCTNADSTNDPSGTKNGARYVLISQPFVIAPVVTALSRPGTEPGMQPGIDAAPSLREAAPGSLELSFSLASEGPVSLVAYDARGRVAAVLLTGRYAPGFHRLSLFSKARRAHPEWILRIALSRAEGL